MTVPSAIVAAERIQFTPALPDKVEAANGLPLGHDDKLFMSLDGAEEFPTSARLFAHTDRTATAGYHIRPFGWPMIEAYFGGACAAELENGGEAAFFDFAVAELVGVMGSEFAKRLKPIRVHCLGRSIHTRSAPIRLLGPATPIAAPCWRSPSMIGCSLPAKRARCTTSPPRMAAI